VRVADAECYRVIRECGILCAVFPGVEGPNRQTLTRVSLAVGIPAIAVAALGLLIAARRLTLVCHQRRAGLLRAQARFSAP